MRLLSSVSRLVNSRRIDEHDLRARQRQHALDRRARGLRPRRDDRQLGPQQRVQQRGFPGVGPAQNRDESRAMFHFVILIALAAFATRT